ncbi:MAG: DUF4492 domain-containing protein [Sulfuricurvum sp.]
MDTNPTLPKRILDLYVDGFRNLKVGRQLWLLLAFKLIVLIGIMKWFFFPDVLETTFATDQARSRYVLENLTKE